VSHPDWCDPARCDAGRMAGRHRGRVTTVRGARHLIATIWLDQVSGGTVRVAVATGRATPEWTPGDALRVAEAIGQVAATAVRERV
jgi:hypothetical protein